MGGRKALLIGIENYGEGFASLAAVRRDIDLMSAALQVTGYSVEICPPEALANASVLDATIRSFCAAGTKDDTHILYFTGHGLLADNGDWIVPAGTSRKNATISPNQRVSTDLSRTVADSSTGLVLFIIDACRDHADVPSTKGRFEWGDPARIERPSEHRFVRLFGCAANQVCQVLPQTEGEPTSSFFTRALANSLSEGDCASLKELLPQLQKHCDELLAQNVLLQAQTPHLSYGESSIETEAVLQRVVFEPVVRSVMASTWDAFDPDKLHCLVVLSEYDHDHQAAPDWWGLRELVNDAVAGETGERIWQSFRAACNGRTLLSGRQRQLPEIFEPSAVSFASFSVVDALASGEALDKAVRMVVEADLVAFDVTGFEPAVMLLIGIRSACCRSLTVCSHGADWREGHPIKIPFNLQDLNISSHTPRDTRVGLDPVVERFVQRVETGFYQISKHPKYLDLPGYDSLRELGPEYEASSTIDVSKRILILCSYNDKLFSNWQFVASRLKQALWQKKRISPAIERIIDYGTPQLVRQSLYEQIRRTAACVVDWSDYSASVFVELGTRLAVSEWGAVQIIDERYLPGGERGHPSAQVDRMRRLLNPIPYQYRAASRAVFEEIADQLLQRNPNLDKDPNYNRVYRVLLPVIGTIQAAHPSIVAELRRSADALHHPQQGRIGAPQILFYGNRSVKADSEKAALELRIAAWLYLEHRVGAAGMKLNAGIRQLYDELARSTVNALYDLGDDESITLADYIEERLHRRGSHYAESIAERAGSSEASDRRSEEG